MGPQVGWESVKEDSKDSCLSIQKDGCNLLSWGTLWHKQVVERWGCVGSA